MDHKTIFGAVLEQIKSSVLFPTVPNQVPPESPPSPMLVWAKSLSQERELGWRSDFSLQSWYFSLSSLLVNKRDLPQNVESPQTYCSIGSCITILSFPQCSVCFFLSQLTLQDFMAHCGHWACSLYFWVSFKPLGFFLYKLLYFYIPRGMSQNMLKPLPCHWVAPFHTQSECTQPTWV